MPKQRFYVFVHDLGQTPLQWEDLITALPAGVGAACPWLRGTRPGGAAVPFTLDDAAAGLITTLDENCAATATLVGAGLGATVALRAAAQFPDRVDAVVAVSAPAQPSRLVLATQRRAMQLTPRRAFAARNLDKDRVLAALQRLADEAGAAPLEAVAAPVTLVVGARDRGAGTVARALAAVLSDASVVEVPDAGDDLPRTAAAALGDIVFADARAADTEGLQPWDLT